MNKILIDTMHIAFLLTDEGGSYLELAQKLDGEKIYKKKINELLSLNVAIIDIDRLVAIRAGELRMRYGLSTGDSMIAATGMVENIKHVLTSDPHFDAIQNFIKPINLKAAINMGR